MTSAGKGDGFLNADATFNFGCKLPHFADGHILLTEGVENYQNIADVICELSIIIIKS